MTKINSIEYLKAKEKLDMISRILEEDDNSNNNIYYGTEDRYKEKIYLIKEILQEKVI